jgi:hypothetical protein
MDTILKTLIEIKRIEEKFAKIQEDPARNGAENGLTNHELEIFEKLIEQIGAASIAADGIIKRQLGDGRDPSCDPKDDNTRN